jgi:hypothetical protein
MTVATAVRQFGPAYAARFGAAMPAGHRRALADLAACRTAAMGGHVTQCDACGVEHFVCHSCRHRQCPTCHGARTRAWTAAREAELLPVPYFHVVFTLPAELRAIVRSHQRVLLGALMQTAAEALQALAVDAHYLGGTVGILAVLHTWTRTLVYHPHVLPRGFHKVRYYGFWRPQAAATRAQLQHQLAPALPLLSARDASDGSPVSSAPRCPHCGQGLVYRTRRLLRASHAPAWIDPP